MKYIEKVFEGKNNFWRYLLSFVVILAFWQIIGMLPLMIGAYSIAGDFESFINSMEDMFVSLNMGNNLFYTLMLLSFSLGLVGIYIAIRWIHKRSIISLITSRKKIDWRRYFFGYGVWMLCSIVYVSVNILITPQDYQWNLNLQPFLILLLISVTLVPLQAAFEEIVFRSYFLQGIGSFSRRGWVPLIITSILFGVLHNQNPEVGTLGFISLYFYIVSGFFFGMVTMLDEGTELALGFHAANNAIAGLYVTANWVAFETDALFINTAEADLWRDMISSVVFVYPPVLIICYFKYRWKNWGEKLFGKIERPPKNLNKKSVFS